MTGNKTNELLLYEADKISCVSFEFLTLYSEFIRVGGSLTKKKKSVWWFLKDL